MTSAPDRALTSPPTHQDVLVLDYLAALWAATDDLPPDERDELMSAVAEYVAARRAANGSADDTAMIVRRLGPPEDLVAAVRRGRLPAHLTSVAVAPAAAPASGRGEQAAVVLLTGGALLLPVLGPLAGMVLASGSDAWSVSQKAAAWLLVIGSVPFGLLVLALTAGGGSGAFALLLAYLATACGPVVAGTTVLRGTDRHGRVA